MKVKELDRTVNVAWSPAAQHPIMVAAGTAAQQLDASFSTNAALEIYSLNLSEPGPDMELRSLTPSDNRFHKLSWGSYGAGGKHEGGIIVGGCDNGRIQMYSAAKLLAGEDGAIAQQDKHTGAVRALDFNPFQSNLLASGASDSEIYIWDLNNTAAPMTPGAKSQPGEDVLWISWNRQVQHILASTFSQRCVVWDLRKNEPIIKLSDSTSRIRWKVVSWHPEVATQLCLASEEDQTPVIQLWDLRFATSPLKVLENHQRGILSIAWCAQDPDLLLSCGKDNRILCWNPNSDMPGGEVVCDLATSNQWNFDVSWCPRNPAIIASASFDGHVSIYSLMGGQSQVQTSNKIADSFPGMDSYAQAPVSQQHQVYVDLKKPPKWLRRPVGASFAFGGKLVCFENDPNSRSVQISQVVTEKELVSRSNHLEATLQYGQYADFCTSKVADSCSQHDRFLWSCLKANFTADPRTELINLLGFKEDELNNKLARFVGKPANARDIANLTDGIASLRRDIVNDGSSADDGEISADVNGEASSAFDIIAATTKATPEKKSFKIKTGDDVDGLICQSLLLGNIEAAVELCLLDGRMADAIILAMTGGSDLLAKTQYRYFQQSKGYLSSLISALVTEDWSQVIRSCDVDSWQEALAAALTHTSTDELPVLCDLLGQRLETEGKGAQLLNAQICYIVAGNLNKLVDSWIASVQPSTPSQLQELVELVMVLRKAVELQGRSVETSGKLAELLSRYASLLASQGSLDAALVYLGNTEEEQIVLLRDRLNRSLGHLPAYQQQQQQQKQQQQQQRGQPQSRGQNFYSEQRNANSPASQGAVNPPARSKYVVDPSVQKASSFSNTYQSTPVANQPKSNFYQPSNPYSPSPSNSSNPYTSSPSPSVPGLSPYAPVQNSIAPVNHYAPGLITSAQLNHYPPGPNAPVTQYAPGPISSAPINQYTPGPISSAPVNHYPPGPSAPLNHYSAGPNSNAPNQYVPGSLQSQPALFNPPASNTYQNQDQYSNDSTPNTLLSNAPPGWNDPPMVNASRNQPKADFVPQNPITHPLYAGTAVAPPPDNQYNYLNKNQPYEHQGYEQQGYEQLQRNVPPQQVQAMSVAKAPEPPKPKAAIPEEHMYLQTVFDELQARCSCAANNPQSRRKLEDVSRKLEALYDALRESKLSGNTLQGLHQMVQLVQIGDYTRGLELHTQLVSGPDFSQIANFMPGLKVLLQSALQLNVYLQ